MFRQASRSLLKRPSHSVAFGTVPRALAQRPLSTSPPAQKSRSWKSSAVRWGLAIGGVYYYNTSIAFAEQLDHTIGVSTESQHDDTKQPTIEALIGNRQKRASSQAQAMDTDGQSSAPMIALQGEAGPREPETAQEYEDEASQEGAFNPETGEINWDCPCLGGMAHGPCGEEFKAAFSCFVYSTEEPKGMDCIDRFKGMQDCFRQHPEVYGSELDGDEDEDGIDEAIDEEEQKTHSSSSLESPLTSSEDHIAPRGSTPSAATEAPKVTGITDSSPKIESTQRNKNSS